MDRDTSTDPGQDRAPDDGVVGRRRDHHARRKRRRRRLHQGIWSVFAGLLGAIGLVLVSLSLGGHMVVLPDWATDRIEKRINNENNSIKLSFSRVELGVGKRGRPRLRVVDLGLRDETGLHIGRLNAVDGTVALGPLFRGRVVPADLSLSGAQITVRRQRSGAFDLSFGQGVGASGDLASVLDRIDTVFTTGIFSRIDQIKAENLTITLEDARSGRIWQVTDGALSVDQTADQVDMTLSFDVFNQTEELAETVLGFRTLKGSSVAHLTATFENARARDIAAQTPLLSFLGLVDAPISGALRTVIDEDGAVSSLAGTLEFGAGRLSPDPTASAVNFTGAKAYLIYDPEQERMNFDHMTLQTDWGEIEADGHSYLRGWSDGWPSELLGQVNVTSATINPPDLFEAPVVVDRGAVDFRLRLDPFHVDVGQFALTHDGVLATGDARVAVGAQGWDIAVDLRADQVTPQQVLRLWPLTSGQKTRQWARDNIEGGHFTDVTLAWRKRGAGPAQTALNAGFEAMTIRAVKHMVALENASGLFAIDGRRLAVSARHALLRPVDRTGKVVGVLDGSGTRFVIPEMARASAPDPAGVVPVPPPVPAWVDLSVSGSVGAALHLLDGKPFSVFNSSKNPAIGPDMVSGQLALGGRIDFALQPKLPREAIKYHLHGTLSDVASDKIVAGRPLLIPHATLAVSPDEMTIDGQGSLSAVPVSGRWVQLFSKGGGRSSVEGDLTLNETLMRAFDLSLPKGSISGSTRGRYRIDMNPNEGAPKMVLEAPLKGVGLAIAPLGWSKSTKSNGTLHLSGTLGAAPVIDDFTLNAPGLSAKGSIILSEGGGLVAAQFDRVKVGGWLDAPVTLTGRGPGKPLAITVKGGTVDMRQATLGAGGAGGGSDDAVPISLLLDRLILSRGIAVNGFSGDFTRTGGGLNGTFRGRIGGGPEIRGTAARQPNGTAFRLRTNDAGGVLRAAGVFQSARGGKMDLILAPGGARGVYDGHLSVSGVSIHNAPAMAELLSAISVVGLMQQLGGQGIPFARVDARFRLDPQKVTIYEGTAEGHAMGISMDGYYILGSEQLDMQGVISPFYIVNSAGRIFARKGEGLIGFNYHLGGTAKNPSVSVNPLSLLTPGFLRDIFRRKSPEPVGQ